VSRAYVGLGANLGNPEASIHRALELLAQTPGIRVLGVSTLRWTEPVGFEDQPRFLNGAAALDTELSARASRSSAASGACRTARERSTSTSCCTTRWS
jgi:2-amino-4-hydroxy-6-hydroxymethyldihydropteridine diphosphokinase